MAVADHRRRHSGVVGGAAGAGRVLAKSVSTDGSEGRLTRNIQAGVTTRYCHVSRVTRHVQDQPDTPVDIFCISEETNETVRWAALLCVCVLELKTKVREDVTEKAPIRAFSWLKVPANAFTFKTITTPKV